MPNTQTIYLSTPFWHTLSIRILIAVCVGMLSATLLWLTHERLLASNRMAAPPTATATPDAPLPLPDTLSALPQQITAPLVVVPYVEHLTSVESILNEEGDTEVVTKDVYNDRTAVILPSELNITAQVTSNKEIKIKLAGKFDYAPLLAEPEDGNYNMRWDKARVLIGISQTIALLPDSSVFWDDDDLELEANTRLLSQIPSGFAAILLEPETEMQRNHTFEVEFIIQQGSDLRFVPLGKESNITITAPRYSMELFAGIKPSKQRRTTDTLSTEWRVSHLVRNYPQYWVQETTTETYDLQNIQVGVSFNNANANMPRFTAPPLSHQSLMLMLVLMSFIIASCLAVELISQCYLHWFHYLLIAGLINIYAILLFSGQPLLHYLSAYQQSSILFLSLILLVSCLLFGIGYGLFMTLLATASLSSFYLAQTRPEFGLLPLCGMATILLLLLFWGGYRAHPPEHR